MAPIATASSWLILSLILFGLNFIPNNSLIFGILEEPPIKITSSISSFLNFESDNALSKIISILSYNSLHSSLNCCLLISINKLLLL